MKKKPQLQTLDASALAQISGGVSPPPTPWKQLPLPLGQPQPWLVQPQPY